MRTIEEIDADIATWTGEPGHNPYIIRRLKAERETVLAGGEPDGKEEKEVLKEKLTEKELFKLTKKGQVAMLEELGAEEIPRYEKGRVELILKLQ